MRKEIVLMVAAVLVILLIGLLLYVLDKSERSASGTDSFDSSLPDRPGPAGS